LFSFGNKEKERLLFLEIELEKLRLENEMLLKKVKEAESAIQIIAANQAYLATEVTNLVSAPSQEKKDPVEEFFDNWNKDDDGGGYIN
tara:strand:+ start:199 stop:462 length:264 start_codon:yes stop_codon:yes gene_type:complete